MKGLISEEQQKELSMSMDAQMKFLATMLAKQEKYSLDLASMMKSQNRDEAIYMLVVAKIEVLAWAIDRFIEISLEEQKEKEKQ